ncbi:MAG TPA: very short patch repair endonuclease [Acidisarcina sp.]
MDFMTPGERSRRMGLIKSRDTLPELAVRKMVHGLGYRFRLYEASLPGRPDIVFTRKRKVIFVHGCFWHLHRGCRNSRPPKSRLEYWGPKLEGNVKRDKLVRRRLLRLRWKCLIVWECELSNPDKLTRRITAFLEPI